MNILHLSIRIGPLSFGVGRAILGLVKHQIRLGHNVSVWSFESEEGVDWACKLADIEPSRVRTFERFGPRSFFYSPQLERQILGAEAGGFDVLHQHAMWGMFGRATKIWSTHTGKPFVVSPHGALEPYYVSKGLVKKRIARLIYADYLFENAACFHACSVKEYESIRKHGVNAPVAVIPNGIEVPACSDGRPKEEKTIKKKRLLYLSRIVPGKGLEMLLDAIASIPEFKNDWELTIAGGGSTVYIDELKRKARKLDMEDSVAFVGFVDGDEKVGLFETSDLFVLPSHSENFGIAVAEALMHGIPSIATKGAPWSDLEAASCGWWVDTDTNSLAAGIRDAISRSDAELKNMGDNGKKLIADNYSSAKAGDMSVQLYQWVVGSIPKPDFIYKSK